MNRQFEAELRQAFSTYASSIPTDASARLRSVDYHPRTGRLTPRLTVGTLGGMAATAGTVISVVVLGGTQPAFAGWSAAPTAASGAEAAAAQSACQAKLTAMQRPGGSVAGSGWTAVITDVRGPFSVVIYQDGSSGATCFTGPSFTVVSHSSTSGTTSSSENSVSGSSAGTGAPGGQSSASIMVGGTASGELNHMTVAHLDSSSDGPYTLAEGQIQTGVSGVTLVRSDGSDVQASTGGGWFVAWWPGSQDVTSAQITTPTGVTNQAINVQPIGLGLPTGTGGPACSSSSSSSSSAQSSSPTTCTGGGAGPGTGGPSTNSEGD